MSPYWSAPEWGVHFDAPKYLLLLAAMPLFWLIGRRSLRALGSWRRHAALLSRLAVATLLIITLAEPNWLTIIDRLTVLFLVDASSSIEREELAHTIDYVNAAARQRDADRGDRAGVVVFGRDAKTEVPPIDGPWQIARLETEVDPRFTNLESALQLAEATFPANTANRVVVVSDGNENVGRAAPQARKMAAEGIGIDVVPIHYERRGDVAIEKLVAPTDVRGATPFAVRVVLNNLAPDQTIAGKVRITRELGGVKQLVIEEEVAVKPGKHVLDLTQELNEAGLSTYEALFLPDNPANDLRAENNAASAFTRVGGRGHVLVIEDASRAGRFSELVGLLRRNEIEVTLRDTRRPYDHLADLQQFDSVILADVPRVAGESADELTQFSDAQIQALVQNTEHFGAGLVVLGGPNSFGVGGWTNTELEKALPVNFEIDNAKVAAVGALVLVIDSSGSMRGEKIQWSKAAAEAAAGILGRRDWLGVVSFDSEAHWVVPVQRNGAVERSKARISRIAAGGGTDLWPALREAYRAIEGADASLKHVIVLTDGLTPSNSHAALAAEMRQRGITTTGVAVGPDADKLLLAEIGRRGGGKFYQVQSPRAIPRIFMREARRVAKPLVFEDRNGIASQIVVPGEMLAGITGPPPPVTGYVLTTVKEDPLVEVLLATPRQPPANRTILATWQFGLGRSVVLTTDVGERWATDWPAWGGYEKLMLQMVRWSMRGHDLDERLALSTEVRDGSIQVVINALDRGEEHLNYLSLLGTVVLPDGQTRGLPLEQVAPGRYVAKLAADEPGNYYLSISAGGRTAPLRTAVSVSNSAEHRRMTSNDSFLIHLAELVPQGGEPGAIITSPRGLADKQRLLATNVFRPGLAPATSRDIMWPAVLLTASLLFVSDVLIRRVLINFDWVTRLTAWLSVPTRVGQTTSSPRMERLKQSKASVAHRMAVSTSAAQIDLESDTAIDARTPKSGSRGAASGAKPFAAELPDAGTEVDREVSSPDFTARLLEAKRRLREGREPSE
jgi:Mg-chelatase subunit ChlD